MRQQLREWWASLWEAPVQPPRGFWHKGKFLVDGVDYHGEHDRCLIEVPDATCEAFF